MFSRPEQDALLNQVRKLTSSPRINSNPVSGFVAKTTTSGHEVKFTVPDATGVGSIDLLSSPYADPGGAKIAQSYSTGQDGYTFQGGSGSASGKQYYWIRLNPTGTSGSVKMVGPQVVQLGN